MIKKTFLLSVLAAAALTSAAQSAPGTWKLVPASGTDIVDVIDTPDHVYYTLSTAAYNNKALYAYDKNEGETTFFAPGTSISDAGVSNFYYNPDGKYLLVTYTNGNIDLIYDSGRIVNLPEIRNSSVTSSKNIRTVKFGKNNRIYIGTEFGLVVYDDQKHVVVESGIYNKPIRFVLPVGDKLLIVHPTTGYLCFADINARHNTLDAFTPIQSVGMDDWQTYGDNAYISTLGGKLFEVRLVPQEGGKYAANFITKAEIPGATKLLPAAGDSWMAASSDKLYMIKDAALESTVSLPADVRAGILASWNGARSVWQSNYTGLGNFDISSGNATVLSQRFKPQGSIQYSANHANTGADGVLYFSPQSFTTYLPHNGSLFDIPVIVEGYDWQTGDVIKNYPEVELSGQYSAEARNAAEKNNSKLLYSGASQVLPDPVVDGLVYAVTPWDGVFGIKDGEVKFRFDRNNSPIEDATWITYPGWLQFDNMGNLWLLMQNYYTGNPHLPNASAGVVKVLKKEALDRLRNNFNASVTLSDWYVQTPFPDDYNCAIESKIVFTSDGKALFIDGTWNGGLFGIDTRNTANTADDKLSTFTALRDQDGLITSPYHLTSLVKDKNENLWIGSTSGIFVVKDLSQLGESSAREINAVRPKVARNDGTTYADFLLSAETVFGIAVDVNNNKWIATSYSGLYQVNPDGTEILKHFTKDNSPLLSNTVTAVACNPDGNDIFLSTPEGHFVYSSESAPTAEDLSDVYAYPNPVRPDYDGWITITGLMENTLVKITDAQGHLVHQDTSEGGMIVWDGRDASGDRVHSGVYLVFASTSGDYQSDKAVTKIVVIK